MHEAIAMTTLTINGPVLVTGGASGIGFAVVKALLDQGVGVALLDNDTQALGNVCDELSGELFTQSCDVRDANSVNKAVAASWAQFGAIRGLVNCAGIYPVTPLLELDAAEWDEVLAVNLRAPFLLTQALAKHWIENGHSARVVNISSTAATLCRPGVLHYGASKAGLSQLTRNLALELAPHGIRVNAVAPGLIATPRVMAHAQGVGAAEHRAKLQRIPMAREGEAQEVVMLVLMLLAEQSSYMTGSVVLVDGGVTLGIPSY